LLKEEKQKEETMLTVNVYDDNLLKYDYDLHQYVLNADAASKYLGRDIYAEYQSQQIANAELINQSNQVYAFLYSRIAVGAERQVEYLIATGGKYRDAMFKALLGQCQYALESRGTDVPLQHGVLLSKGVVIPQEALRGSVQVSLATEQALSKSGLLYCGAYKFTVPNSVYRVGY